MSTLNLDICDQLSSGGKDIRVIRKCACLIFKRQTSKVTEMMDNPFKSNKMMCFIGFNNLNKSKV